MNEATAPAGAHLYHAASSYYSMIARLALTEGGVAYTSVPVDIHRRKEQFAPDYVRLNPGMTVPTLQLPDRVLTESRDILFHALGGESPASRRWVDLQYAFPIEELTFGLFLSWNPLARRAIPRQLAAVEALLRTLAQDHPDLAPAYLRRAEVFAGRVQAFDPDAVRSLAATRMTEACGLLDTLEQALSDGRSFLVPQAYGPADVVWTVFLARIHFLRRGEEIERRPAVARYEAAMLARPSFDAADVWSRIHPWKLVRQFI